MKNKKAQLDNPILNLLAFSVILIVMAIIFLKFFLITRDYYTPNLGNVTNGGEIARDNMNAVLVPLITAWDKVIIACFAFSVIALFITAISIDASPIFVVAYILINFFLVIFAPYIINSADAIYSSSQFSDGIIYLPMVNALRTHYMGILVGLIVITGIIIYGKISNFFGGGSTR